MDLHAVLMNAAAKVPDSQDLKERVNSRAFQVGQEFSDVSMVVMNRSLTLTLYSAGAGSA